MSVINKVQLETMFKLQTSFNERINLKWKESRYPFVDAIWTEAAEGFDHTNWPWWKKAGQKIDIAQVQMELIDIWHFLMSELMMHSITDGGYVDMVTAINLVIEETEMDTTIEGVREGFRGIVRAALLPADETRIVILLASFIKCLNDLGMSWEDLYKMYVGKNTLNTFRQKNGYKADTAEYLKRWASLCGWEDNQYLEQLLTQIDANKPVEEFQADILNGMQSFFDETAPKQKAA